MRGALGSGGHPPLDVDVGPSQSPPRRENSPLVWLLQRGRARRSTTEAWVIVLTDEEGLSPLKASWEQLPSLIETRTTVLCFFTPWRPYCTVYWLGMEYETHCWVNGVGFIQVPWMVFHIKLNCYRTVDTIGWLAYLYTTAAAISVNL